MRASTIRGFPGLAASMALTAAVALSLPGTAHALPTINGQQCISWPVVTGPNNWGKCRTQSGVAEGVIGSKTVPRPTPRPRPGTGPTNPPPAQQQ